MLQNHDTDFTQLTRNIKQWGKELGFQEVRISDCDLTEDVKHLERWIERGFHGSMSYMANNIDKRAKPENLHPGTIRIISVRLDYIPQGDRSKSLITKPKKAFVARYALGRDYHKVIKAKLKKLAEKINLQVDQHQYRAFVDSAPIMERAIAAKAGLGWIGKNTMLINRQAGSYFFLGELFTNIPLPVDNKTTSHCGSCSACISICPTKAIVAPYQLDARKCISYLTIESKTSIPTSLRPLMGNRIFGCDDCQLICPWNKFAKPTDEKDFKPRHNLESTDLIKLFLWSEEAFLKNTEGSAIRRTGYNGWLRNIAVALGNAPRCQDTLNALRSRLSIDNDMVKEHIEWAIRQQLKK